MLNERRGAYSREGANSIKYGTVQAIFNDDRALLIWDRFRSSLGQSRIKLYTLFRTERPKTLPYPAAHPRTGHIKREYPPGDMSPGYIFFPVYKLRFSPCYLCLLQDPLARRTRDFCLCYMSLRNVPGNMPPRAYHHLY